MRNKPELLSFSDYLMISPSFDLRQFFGPEIEHLKGGVDGLLASGLMQEEGSELIEYHEKVAVIRIDGPMRPGRDWYFSVGYGDIQDAITELMDRKEITTVIQYLDTPGGTVKEAFETESMFYKLSAEKKLVSAIEMATSAGALMSFPAKERYLVSKTAQTGSIGVVAEHINNIAWYREMWGEVRTSVAKGEMKDAGTDTRPYDAKAKEVFENSVSKLYDIFAESASVGLGKSIESIEAQESRVYIGQDGIDQGFADGFATLDSLIEKYNNEGSFSTPGRPAFSNIQSEEKRMDKNQFKAEHPDVYKQIGDEREAAVKQQYVDEGEAKGIILERKRMNDIDALSLPPEFAAKAKKEDWTAEQTASKYLLADAEKRKNISENMQEDLQEAVETDAPEMPKQEEAKNPATEFEAKVQEKVNSGMKRTVAIVAAAKENPELHQNYVNAQRGGK